MNNEAADLTHKTAALSRMAPQEWAEFLESFRKYTDRRRDECVQAPSDALHVTQGRAQQSASLLGLFEGAVKSADRAAEKREMKQRSI